MSAAAQVMASPALFLLLLAFLKVRPAKSLPVATPPKIVGRPLLYRLPPASLCHGISHQDRLVTRQHHIAESGTGALDGHLQGID